MVQFSSALKRTMYDFKNSFFPNFLLNHRAKYIFSRDMFCLYHFRAKIHGVRYKSSWVFSRSFFWWNSMRQFFFRQRNSSYFMKKFPWAMEFLIWYATIYNSSSFSELFWTFLMETEFFKSYSWKLFCRRNGVVFAPLLADPYVFKLKTCMW